jgi:hypothetical protein
VDIDCTMVNTASHVTNDLLLRRKLCGWAELAHLPYLAAVEEKEYWGWNHSDAKKAQQRRSPIYAKIMIERRGEERKPTTSK